MNRFEDIVVGAFNNIIKAESLYSKMEERYQKLKSKYIDKHDEVIKNFNA